MVGVDKKICDTEFQIFTATLVAKKAKITHMDIKIQLFGRFCTDFDMLQTLMKGSGILKIEILVVTLAAKWRKFTCMAIKTELLCRIGSNFNI